MPTTSTTLLDRYRGQFLLLTMAWTASGVIIYFLAPLAAAGLVLLSPLAPIAWCLATKRRLPQHKPSAVTLALVFAGAYLCLNASWSLSAGMAHVALAVFFMLVLALYLTSNALQELDADILRAMVIGLYAGMAIGGAVMFFEIFSLQWIRRTIMSLVPALRPKPREMLLDGQWVVYLEPYLINRNVTAMIFLFWPTAFAIWLVAPPSRRHWWLAGLVPVVAAILGSKHATSKIALFGAAATFATCHYWPAATRRLLVWGWVATIMLVVPVATLAYQSKLYLSPWIPYSAQHRIVIWGYTSSLIAASPFLGSGINTARALNDPDGPDTPRAPGSDFRLTTNLHSHNDYLQVWYEAGAVGALILLGVGLLMLNALALAATEAQPYLYATFVTCALLAGSSFSLWAPWFMASFAFAACFSTVGWALAQRLRLQTPLAAPDSGHS